MKPVKRTLKQTFYIARHVVIVWSLPSRCGNFCPSVLVHAHCGTLIFLWTGS